MSDDFNLIARLEAGIARGPNTVPTPWGQTIAEAVSEITRLREAKRRALAIADERSKENVALRAALAAAQAPPNIWLEAAAKLADTWHGPGLSYAIRSLQPVAAAQAGGVEITMRKDNPACYECPKNPSGVHVWMKKSGGRAECLKCGLVLSARDTAEVFYDHEARIQR